MRITLTQLVGVYSSDRPPRVHGNATEYYTCNKCLGKPMIPRRVLVDDSGVSPLHPIVCPHCGTSEVDAGEVAFTFQKVYGDDE